MSLLRRVIEIQKCNCLSGGGVHWLWMKVRKWLSLVYFPSHSILGIIEVVL